MEFPSPPRVPFFCVAAGGEAPDLHSGTAEGTFRARPASLDINHRAATTRGRMRCRQHERVDIMSSKVSVPNGGLVVVADYGKALLIRNNGSPITLELEVTEVLEAPDNPPSHEQGTDRPGRAAFGSHRSAVEQTDWHAVAGRRFIEKTVRALEKACAGGVEAVVLVAPPRALADFRDTIPAGLRSAVVAELDKDLTGLPVEDIARHLAV